MAQLTPLRLLAAVLFSLALLAAACGGSSSGDKDVLTPVPTGQLLPVIVSSDLGVGQNRFLLGLINQSDNSPVLGAQLQFNFLLSSGDQIFQDTRVTAKALQVTKSYTHTHADGTVETHQAGETGAYEAQVAFDRPGTWNVHATGTANGASLDASASLTVLDKSQSPAVGQPSPRSIQTVLKDVSDISQIDTSFPPIPEEHDMTIADAVTSGKPTVIVFATPAFCTSQICGPTKSVVDELYKNYQAQANFIHVEPYDLAKARAGQGLEPLPWIVSEWGLTSEPWVFLVDKQGNIAGKFEGIVTTDELDAALTPLLAPAG